MKKDLLVITGAFGFIGSNVTRYFVEDNKYGLILVDREKRPQYIDETMYETYIDADSFFDISPELVSRIKAVIHLGASVNTGETDKDAVFKNNYEYSKKIYDFCALHSIQLIYASSAATYGNGENGFDDTRHDLVPQNYYAESKHAFDKFVRDDKNGPPQVVGLKFFNVYGPFESHKGRMASTVLFSYKQAHEDGVIKLFRSYNSSYKDGEQKRDFIYAGDVPKVINSFLKNPNISGIYNLGTGEARTFIELANAVFSALKKEPRIEFIEMPEQFKKQYQYFTKADMRSLRSIGYTEPMTTLEDGVAEYIAQLEKA